MKLFCHSSRNCWSWKAIRKHLREGGDVHLEYELDSELSCNAEWVLHEHRMKEDMKGSRTEIQACSSNGYIVHHNITDLLISTGAIQRAAWKTDVSPGRRSTGFVPLREVQYFLEKQSWSWNRSKPFKFRHSAQVWNFQTFLTAFRARWGTYLRRSFSSII